MSFRTLRFLLTTLLLSSPALAAKTRLHVAEKSDDTEKILQEPIDVDLHGTVADALQAITKKTGWSLIASSPTLDQRLSLQTKKRPLKEALELVLEAADLHATLRPGGKLVVSNKHTDDADDDEPRPDDDDEDDDDERKHGGIYIPIPPAPPTPPLPPKGRRHGKNDRVAYGEDLLIAKDEVVADAVANGGDLIVEGRVTGDAVAMGGDVIVQRGGVVEGDASAIGGEVVIENGGIIKGNTQKFGGAFGGVLKGLAKRAGRPHHADIDKDEDAHEGGSGMFTATLLLAVLAFILNIMLIAFVPERVERVIQTLDERPLQSGGAGFALMLGFLPFCLILVVTIIGIFFVPLAFAAYALIYIFGYAALSVYVGRKLPLFKNRKTALGAMALGLAALTLVAIIPYVGPMAVIFTTTFAAGAVALSRFGSGPKIIDDSLQAL